MWETQCHHPTLVGNGLYRLFMRIFGMACEIGLSHKHRFTIIHHLWIFLVQLITTACGKHITSEPKFKKHVIHSDPRANCSWRKTWQNPGVIPFKSSPIFLVAFHAEKSDSKVLWGCRSPRGVSPGRSSHPPCAVDLCTSPQ